MNQGQMKIEPYEVLRTKLEERGSADEDYRVAE
jgi:hypothetical protein